MLCYCIAIVLLPHSISVLTVSSYNDTNTEYIKALLKKIPDPTDARTMAKWYSIRAIL